MADMILLGLAIICTAYFMVIVLCRYGNLLCLYLAFLCCSLCISCIWKMVLQEKYGPHPTVGAGEHCYYLYCRCGHYGSPLYHGVYGSGSQ